MEGAGHSLMLGVAQGSFHVGLALKGQYFCYSLPCTLYALYRTDRTIMQGHFLLGRGGWYVQPSETMHMWKESSASRCTGAPPRTRPREA